MDSYSYIEPTALKHRKGETRWNQFSETLNDISPEALNGPILDFGSGFGHLILEGLRRSMNI